jgi:hypothetical protein
MSEKTTDKKAAIFKFRLTELLKFLEENYGQDYMSFSIYRRIVQNMSLIDIKGISKDLRPTVLEFSEEIRQKNEEFFVHLKPHTISDNFLVINEISNIKNLYNLPKTNAQMKDKIWSFISQIHDSLV